MAPSLYSSFSSVLFFIILVVASVGVMVESRQMKKVAAEGDFPKNENIDKVCAQSLDKELCLKCINSDHSRESNDMRELTHSMIFCLWSQSTYTRVDANQLFQNTTDARLKKVYEVCDTDLYAAQTQLGDSMTLFENYDYKNSSQLMYTACDQQLNDCLEKIGKYDSPESRIKISQQFLDDSALFVRFCDVTQMMMTLVPNTPPPPAV